MYVDFLSCERIWTSHEKAAILLFFQQRFNVFNLLGCVYMCTHMHTFCLVADVIFSSTLPRAVHGTVVIDFNRWWNVHANRQLFRLFRKNAALFSSNCPILSKILPLYSRCKWFILTFLRVYELRRCSINWSSEKKYTSLVLTFQRRNIMRNVLLTLTLRWQFNAFVLSFRNAYIKYVLFIQSMFDERQTKNDLSILSKQTIPQTAKILLISSMCTKQTTKPLLLRHSNIDWSEFSKHPTQLTHTEQNVNAIMGNSYVRRKVQSNEQFIFYRPTSYSTQFK